MRMSYFNGQNVISYWSECRSLIVRMSYFDGQNVVS